MCLPVSLKLRTNKKSGYVHTWKFVEVLTNERTKLFSTSNFENIFFKKMYVFARQSNTYKHNERDIKNP